MPDMSWSISGNARSCQFAELVWAGVSIATEKPKFSLTMIKDMEINFTAFMKNFRGYKK